jgi:sigma-B regulation protein RsbU (phosphoserine phosphatase)
VPAESVGGDFYQLFRLGGGRTGVMLGDVSSHGYGAALIMALAMSASAIHAQIAAGPAEMLRSLLSSLSDELASTEMSISAFYGVVDRRGGQLSYANAGMPHAFVIDAEGRASRLGATVPPLGMGEAVLEERSRPWSSDDELLLFTDGLTDAHAADGARFGEARVLEVVQKSRSRSPAETLADIFEALSEHIGFERQPDDQTCIILRS